MINFLTLKEEFRKYLLEKRLLEDDEMAASSDVSIFEYIL